MVGDLLAGPTLYANDGTGHFDITDVDWAMDEQPQVDWLPKESATDRFRRGGRGVEKGTGYVRLKPAKWQEMVPLRIRAMVLAGDKLVAAGVPDVVDPDDPLASFEGRKGALLNVYSAKDGKLLKSHKLPSPAAFDATIAAQGALFIATDDGKLIRMN